MLCRLRQLALGSGRYVPPPRDSNSSEPGSSICEKKRRYKLVAKPPASTPFSPSKATFSGLALVLELSDAKAAQADDTKCSGSIFQRTANPRVLLLSKCTCWRKASR